MNKRIELEKDRIFNEILPVMQNISEAHFLASKQQHENILNTGNIVEDELSREKYKELVIQTGGFHVHLNSDFVKDGIFNAVDEKDLISYLDGNINPVALIWKYMDSFFDPILKADVRRKMIDYLKGKIEKKRNEKLIPLDDFITPPEGKTKEDVKDFIIKQDTALWGVTLVALRDLGYIHFMDNKGKSLRALHAALQNELEYKPTYQNLSGLVKNEELCTPSRIPKMKEKIIADL
jgi:hypothetical protein